MKRMVLFAYLAVNSCFAERVQSSLVPEVVQSYLHDREAFTEGLMVHQGSLYEGTGLEGKSELREVNLETGIVKRAVKNTDEQFGEGIAQWKDQIFQLTWKNKKALVYDAQSFDKIKEFELPTKEGWGLTSNGDQLIISDGTDRISFVDPLTFRVIRTIQVRNDNRIVDQINELEYVNGKILANIWHTHLILVINPEQGKVEEVWDMSSLVQAIPEFERKNIDVLNGIAYDAEAQKLYVTGKFWPRLFEVRIPGSIVF